jgi:hypothetical protein
MPRNSCPGPVAAAPAEKSDREEKNEEGDCCGVL